MTTRTKFALAGLLYSPLAALRSACGKDSIVKVSRSGINWSLDLNQAVDFSIYLTGSFQGASIRSFTSMVAPGDVVLDIGANIGSHALPLARTVGSAGRVYAFEPTRFAFAKLKENVSLNPELAGRIVAEQMVVTTASSDEVPAAIHSNWPIDTSEEVHRYHRGIAMDTAGALADSIDGYCGKHGIDKVSAIKIDVDGFEGKVLRGARETLRRFRPTMMIELEPCLCDVPGHEPFEEIPGLLAQAGYRLHSTVDRSPLPMDSRLRNLIPNGSSLDALALPV